MLRVPVIEARPGMVLAQAVTHPQRADTVLLRPGATLDRFNTPKLGELGVREIWIRHPGLEDLVRFADPQTLAAYREVAARVGAAMDRAVSEGSCELEFHQFRDTVVTLLERLGSNPASALLVTELGACAGPAARHAGNTCFVSLLLGIKLDYYLIRERSRMNAHTAKDLASLGLGALFHDIGLTRSPPGSLEAWSKTGDEHDPLWTEHTRVGYDMVKDHLDPSAAGVVLHHHQHFDGSGFPHRTDATGNPVPLRGSEIHVYARITACAELYDRARFGAFLPGEAERPPIPAVKALAALRRSPMRERIDPVILRTLHQVVPTFAPGSIVDLSDGRRGAVVSWSPRDPCRPIVQILSEPPARAKRSDERVDLSTTPSLRIAKVDGTDVGDDAFAIRDLEPLAAAA